MKNSKRFSSTRLTVIAISLMAVSPAALAYLDPSTGSMVVSAIVGIIASIALALKTYWYKIKSFFRRDNKQDSASRDTAD